MAPASLILAPLTPARRQPECLVCGHPHAVPLAARRTRFLDGRPGCPGCPSCRTALTSPPVPPGLEAAHVLVLACVEDLVWEDAQEVVGVVDVARRFALHVWPAVGSVPLQAASWADTAWVVDECLEAGLLASHPELGPSPVQPRPGRDLVLTGLSLTRTGRGVLDVVTWRPIAD